MFATHGIIQSIQRGGGIVTDGLLLNLDAGDAASYPGTGTTWTDLSGNGYNGTLTNGPTYDSANGGSIVFDASNDYVVISNNSSFNTSNVTIEVVFKATQLGQDGVLFGRWASGANANNSYLIYIGEDGTTSKYSFAVTQSNVTNKFVTSTNNLVVNNWYHLVATADGSNLNIYLNNVKDNNITSYNGTISTNTTPISLGYLGSSAPVYYYQGHISIARLYNRALSGSEIQQNFNFIKDRYGL